MSEAMAEKAVCSKCGVDVRDGTTFCYNCGSKVAELLVVDDARSGKSNGAEAGSGIDESAETIKIDNTPDGNSLARAADERRKSRVGLRRTREYAWEPSDDSRPVALAAVLIAVIALAVVFLMVFWK